MTVTLDRPAPIHDDATRRQFLIGREWATLPWVRGRLGGAHPAVLARNELNFELIATLEPDLIVGVASA